MSFSPVKLLLILGIASSFFIGRIGDCTIATKIDESLNSLIPHNASWGVAVVDMTTGTETLRVGSAKDAPMVPGSLVKLITTGAVLDQAVGKGKPDMRTMLSHDGIIRDNELRGNLYLTGRGNTNLSTDDLRGMVNELSRMGIAKVAGDIVGDSTLLDARGLERKRQGPAYASAGALGLDLHTVAITVFPTEPGKSPAVKVEPLNDAVRVAVEARTVEAGSSTLRITQLDDLSFKVTGNVPVGTAMIRQRFPLKNPALYAGGAFRTLLRDKGIAAEGAVRKGKTPPEASRLAEVPSPNLAKLLRDMNVNSLNVVADNLLLLRGGERYSFPGTRDNGLEAVGEFIRKLGLPADGVRIVDGSGLDHNNRITAAFMAHYLQKVAAKKWFDSLYDSLPRAGREGTLRDMGFIDQHFRVKSGSLENAYALAGYGVDGAGRKVAFAFIVNHPGISAMGMKRAGAEVMRLISTEVFQ